MGPAGGRLRRTAAPKTAGAHDGAPQAPDERADWDALTRGADPSDGPGEDVGADVAEDVGEHLAEGVAEDIGRPPEGPPRGEGR